MWKNTRYLMLICKELLPQSKSITNNGSNSSFDLDAIVQQLYDKYFKDRVLNHKMPQHNDKEELRQLLAQGSNQPASIVATAQDIWIFGYGSLVWKADFPFIDRRRGFICGYQRRFYQHSIDHRGTSVQPGRVVTLLPTGQHEDRVYGMAYRIAASHKDNVLQHLDYREKNGYERCQLTFHQFPESTNVHFDITMYVATHQNDSYAGDVWQLPSIADQIFTSAGPSGPNREYLFNLAHAMRMLFPGVEDKHLYELEDLVLNRIENVEAIALEQALKKQIIAILDGEETSMHAIDEVQWAQKSVNDIEFLDAFCSKPGWREAFLTKQWLSNQCR